MIKMLMVKHLYFMQLEKIDKKLLLGILIINLSLD